MKIMSIFGTRPEIIRLSRILPLLDENFEHVMVNTNQNFTPELSSLFFKELKLRPADYDLKVKTGNFGNEVSDILKKTSKVIENENPECLLILGDTNSGLSCIPAAHQGIKIVHLEAGMRSYNPLSSEEKNRVVIDHLSTVLLPYTQYSRENLIRENIHPSKIFTVGNPIIEVIEYYMPKIKKSNILQKLKLKQNNYFLVTAHRGENVDNIKSLKNILCGLEKIYKKFGKIIIYPIHPRTMSKIKNIKIPNYIKLIDPLGFFDFTNLEKNAFCVLTDSGTIPEEMLYFQKPCVTIRDYNERPEMIEAGSNILSGLNPEKILNSTESIVSGKIDWKWNPALGDGKTSRKVINILHGKMY
jgi:UDP-N-acetylglucosamine 2-epimerase (non-hydrolysing)